MRKHILCKQLAILFCSLVLFFSNAGAAADLDKGLSTNNDAQQETMPLEEAIDWLSQELNARVVVFGAMDDQKVTTILSNRSPLDQLKSILKGHDYAIIYNDPSPSYDCFDSLPVVADAQPYLEEIDSAGIGVNDAEPGNDGEHQRLAHKIEQLEQEIESGEADAFFERWSKIKGSKYIFDHRRELDRLRKKLALLDDQESTL